MLIKRIQKESLLVFREKYESYAELKQNEQEFKAENFWENNRQMIMTIGTVLICAVLMGLVAWMVYKMVMMGRSDGQMLTNALNNFAERFGGTTTRPPG